MIKSKNGITPVGRRKSKQSFSSISEKLTTLRLFLVENNENENWIV